MLRHNSKQSGESKLNSRLRKISPRHIDRRTCYQLSWRKVDAQNVINWTVVGQLS